MNTSGDSHGPLFAKPAETTPSAQPLASAQTDWQAAFESLRRLFHISLAVQIVLFAGLNLFLFHQVRAVRSQASELTRQVGQMAEAVNDYATNTGPRLERILVELHRFADTHPDFASIMTNYPRPPTAASRRASAPVPSTPSASAPPVPTVAGPATSPPQPARPR